MSFDEENNEIETGTGKEKPKTFRLGNRQRRGLRGCYHPHPDFLSVRFLEYSPHSASGDCSLIKLLSPAVLLSIQ